MPTFQYRASRYDLLTPAIEVCTGAPLRQAYTDMLERLSMADSVPGQDAPRALASAIASQNDLTQLRSELAARMERYTRVLDRLATPYSVDSQRRPSPSQYVSGTLTPATGLISTVRDLAKFDLALRRGILLRPETTAAAWKPQSGRDEKPLPHGLGWFVQTYRGEPVVWQFGLGENASSSLIVTLPARSLTFVLLANSSGLAKAFPLASGDLTVSPFGRVFLGFFVR